jgi:hypothetical protein
MIPQVVRLAARRRRLALGCQSFSLPTARRHTTTSLDWAEAHLGGLVRHAGALLKGPFFTSSALALPLLPHPLPLRIFAQAIVLVRCSSVFLCVDGVLCSREFLWPLQVSHARTCAAPLVPLSYFSLCLGGRPLRAAGCVVVHAPRVTHFFGADCAQQLPSIAMHASLAERCWTF